MKRLFSAIGLAIAALGCDSSTPDLGPTTPAGGCGDSICQEDETVLSCPEDCLQIGSSVQVEVDLDACASDLDEATVERALALTSSIVRSFDDGVTSFAEEGQSLGWGALDSLDALAQEPTRSSLPGPFMGKSGVYTADLDTLGDANLTGTFFFGADYAAGKKGDAIVPSLFEIESYVEGADIHLSGENLGTATVAYDDTGPLVELLGFGTTPPNPFMLDVFDEDQEIKKERLDLEASVTSLDPSIRWKASSSFVLSQLGTDVGVETSAIPIQIHDFAAANDELAETATLDSGAASVNLFEQGTNSFVLRGKLAFTVKGGQLPHRAEVLFDDDGVTASITCAN